MQDWLYAQAQANPEKIALVTSDGQRTFHQLQKEVSERAAILKSLNVTLGTRVGLLLPNSAEYVILMLAILRCGSVIVPLNIRLQSEEIAYQLKNAAVNLLLTAPVFHDTVCRALASANILSDVLSVYSLCETTQDGLFTPLPTYDLQQRQYPDLSPTIEHKIEHESPLGIIHTSGTSGKPKGALLTYGNVFYSALASAYRLGHLPDDKWLCTLPLFHVGGLSIVLRAVLYGITVDLREKFDVAAVNHALAHERITLVSLVPTMLYRLLEARGEPWSNRLRLVLLGGAPASPDLIQRCQDEDIPVATTYGMTEAASQVATALPELVQRKPGSVGKPLLYTQVRVVDEYGGDQPSGAYGDVVVRGPTVMKEYINDAAVTAKVLSSGWLHTGDIGYLDEDGDLWIVQRRTDLIISGGENIYPAEVENVLRQHPAVKEAVVIGLTDAEWGQQVAAAVQLHDGYTLTQQDLITFCRGRLAGYKVPRVIHFLEELPQTESGKIARTSIYKLFEEH